MKSKITKKREFCQLLYKSMKHFELEKTKETGMISYIIWTPSKRLDFRHPKEIEILLKKVKASN
jgi:hypothetical protein